MARPGRDWSKLTPEQRRVAVEPAARGRRRVGADRHIREIIARAGDLSPEQIELLRSVLPPVAPDDEDAAS